MKTQNQSIFYFFWTAMRPYKYWYLLVFQGPVLSTFYYFFYNYSIKLIIDLMIHSPVFSWDAYLLPVLFFIGSNLYLNIVWRLTYIGYWKAYPYTIMRLITETFGYVTQHQYSYFQQMPSGKLLSKAKGLIDHFDTLFDAIYYRFSTMVLQVLLGWTALAFMSAWLGFLRQFGR